MVNSLFDQNSAKFGRHLNFLIRTMKNIPALDLSKSENIII